MRSACRKFMLGLLIASLAVVGGGLFAAGPEAAAATGIQLYTAYTDLSAPPGDSISYDVEVINKTEAIRNVALAVHSSAADWKTELTASGRAIRSIAVKPGESQTVNLRVTVPLKVNKGSYTFQLAADGGAASLPLKVEVTEQGTFSSELTADQPNMEGHADTTFSYTAKLRNRTASEQNYALSAAAPEGWDIRFKSGGNNVTSVKIDAGGEQSISIDAVPPQNVKAGAYKIPVSASNNATSAETVLEAVVTGTYDIELSTADERLNASVTAGSTRKLDLVVRNTGTAEQKDVSLSAQTPTDWEVTFEPSVVRSLPAGETARVQATIKADNKALAGDYVVNMSAAAAGKSSEAPIRVAVKTSVLWGWIGVLIILAVVAGIGWLFRKYGRR